MAQSMAKKLLDGVRRFQTEEYPSRRELFHDLATGQSPKVLFITCADSRIDPSLVTQTDPGEVFIVRNAGNLVPDYTDDCCDGTSASVEFAVAALGVTNVVVCGHSGCGAMAAFFDPRPAVELPAVGRWLVHGPERADDDTLHSMIEKNVALQLDHLRTHPSIEKAEAAGDLVLHGWVYDIGSGGVSVLGDDGAFAPIA